MSALTMWVVYRHPADLPAEWAARQWTVTAAGPEATDVVLHADTEAEVVALLEAIAPGLVRLEPTPDDDPVIAGVYL